MKHETEKQTKKQQKPVVIVCILILVLAAVGVGNVLYQKVYSYERTNGSERNITDKTGRRRDDRDRPGNRDYGGAKAVTSG
ncbi:MAG: hypothetical protein ACLTX6_01085 [Lachnospiraceae bacterium]